MIDTSNPKAKIIFQASGYLDAILLHNQQAENTSAGNLNTIAALSAIVSLRHLAAIHYTGSTKQIETALDNIQQHLLYSGNDEKSKNELLASIGQLDKLFGTWAI